MADIMTSVFFQPQNKKLAKAISIRSPSAFKKSVSTLRKSGVTTTEKRALSLAQTRAKLMLRRKNLSSGERVEFRKIASVKLPMVTKHYHRR